MTFNQNTTKFLSKLSKVYKTNEEIALQILNEKNFGKPSAQFQDGKLISLNIRGIPWGVQYLWKRLSKDKIEMKILNLEEIDISDLTDLIELSFRANEKTKKNYPIFAFNNIPNLTFLEFQNHNVQSISLDQNLQLTDLNCSMNELADLNLSNNLELTRLNCQMNKISKLDLTKNSKIEYLNIRYNPIKTSFLQFPKNNNIKELYIDETPIKIIELDNFKNLKKLKVGQLEKLNVSACNYLNSLTLIRTKLESLDISDNQTLTDFSIWQGEITELCVNEFQSMIMPELGRKIKVKPTLDQKELIKSYILHRKALSHNWDEGLHKLKKILNDKNCSKATAAAIFWIGRPNFFLRFKKVSDAPDHTRESFRFLNKLEKKLLENKYSNSTISFNPKKYLNNDWTVDSLDTDLNVREIPEELKNEVLAIDSDLFDLSKKYTLNYR